MLFRSQPNPGGPRRLGRRWGARKPRAWGTGAGPAGKGRGIPTVLRAPPSRAPPVSQRQSQAHADGEAKKEVSASLGAFGEAAVRGLRECVLCVVHSVSSC